ncbi:hypothetical protein CHLRE_17g721553v5 [Chlamydomonas reinhardtii]|uniref:Uncharacterized protein n=1 Tax=Chlamydomonas reinhardtii TaxID=3055 RepID=A8J6F7_CHLRE|nr:uncharacterized protein CHLRE_17g721553v5 [Chlamydomonas reinhardtii]PNW70478.1 hypothetical protein CHLRE_17g721553v5 [Chlamydomonas reinhardtii]|eukprot:XP_001697118.1 predicted protein [Chlamydomonas reinhardtii]
MLTTPTADTKSVKTPEERAKGLAALYWSTAGRVEPEPVKPVKLRELPPDHPWAACWQALVGMEVMADPVRIVRG